MLLKSKKVFLARVISLIAFGLLFNSLSYAATKTDKNTISWAGCGITKKAFMKEMAKAYETKTGIKIVLNGGGATRGIRDTARLKMDLGGACRMNLPEVDRIELHASMHPVAWDALAIIVNKKNPVNSLSTKQVKAIYTGKITNWKQVGGKDAPIRLYVRRGTISGVGYAIRQYIFKDRYKKFITNKKYITKSSGPLEKAVVKDVYAMGITGVSSARKRNVKIIGFDGKVPSYENVASGKYTLYRPLYLVTSPSPSKKVKNFIKFVVSKEGRKIIRDNNTVPYKDAPALQAKMLIYGFDIL
ncbi:Phosphate ABC transporter, periplasmic phosphate-binding protein PstS (TC 3.A.1.7.1) [hydrothermal vent metagenome]|uniref:Phosphate ABC transporter, periplasmic phosphate-binding protein PstS (TC 3.A.1.7.1) n=1 Tax=hydrothermal vent metagenome TaxID=652676 RepID=A0A3B1ABG4_9ZZZZ